MTLIATTPNKIYITLQLIARIVSPANQSSDPLDDNVPVANWNGLTQKTMSRKGMISPVAINNVGAKKEVRVLFALISFAGVSCNFITWKY